MNEGSFDYLSFYDAQVQEKKRNKSYRYLTNINRMVPKFPKAHLLDPTKEVTVWCTTDYLGMTSNQYVINEMHRVLDQYGTGSGGSRSVSGHNVHLCALERTCSRLHAKEAALVFTSGFIANDATLATIAARMPNCTILSDVENHGSIIAGVTHSRAKKIIFAHNDVQDLEAKLRTLPRHDPKIIAFESLYSISGQIAPVQKICDLAEQYGATTFLDETHAVGMYGPHGGGIAEHLDFEAHAKGEPKGTVMDRVDIISASLAKAYGSIGGYIAGPANLVDMVRSLSPSFIFTTTLPPPVAAGAQAAVEYLRENAQERRLQHSHGLSVKYALAKAGIPAFSNQSHIIPILIGDADKAYAATDMLLDKWGIYAQSVGFPTVSFGQECLRLCATNGHTPQLQDELLEALVDVWDTLGIRKVRDWQAMGSSFKFSDTSTVRSETTWTERQLEYGRGRIASRADADSDMLYAGLHI